MFCSSTSVIVGVTGLRAMPPLALPASTKLPTCTFSRQPSAEAAWLAVRRASLESKHAATNRLMPSMSLIVRFAAFGMLSATARRDSENPAPVCSEPPADAVVVPL
eukprot:1995711-Amphidinium_carterae.1